MSILVPPKIRRIRKEQSLRLPLRMKQSGPENGQESRGGSSMGTNIGTPNSKQGQQNQQHSMQQQQQQRRLPKQAEGQFINQLAQKLMEKCSQEVRNKLQNQVNAWPDQKKQQISQQGVDPLFFRFREHAEMLYRSGKVQVPKQRSIDQTEVQQGSLVTVAAAHGQNPEAGAAYDLKPNIQSEDTLVRTIPPKDALLDYREDDNRYVDQYSSAYDTALQSLIPHQFGSQGDRLADSQAQTHSRGQSHQRPQAQQSFGANMPLNEIVSISEANFRGHKRTPSESAYSDISSAHALPFLVTHDSFEDTQPSPHLSAQADPQLFQGPISQFDQFTLNDGTHISPGHSPAISPRLIPQQQSLPAFMPGSFGIESNMHNQFAQQQGIGVYQNQGKEVFPSLSEFGQAMTPPEINIDYAPPGGWQRSTKNSSIWTTRAENSSTLATSFDRGGSTEQDSSLPAHYPTSEPLQQQPDPSRYLNTIQSHTGTGFTQYRLAQSQHNTPHFGPQGNNLTPDQLEITNPGLADFTDFSAGNGMDQGAPSFLPYPPVGYTTPDPSAVDRQNTVLDSRASFSDHAQTVEVNNQFEAQRKRRKQYLDDLWNRPHEPPVQPTHPTFTGYLEDNVSDLPGTTPMQRTQYKP
ncbi:DNA-binding transcription factor [Curvularia kusanoi]|uniref:DNA-binding transcription factor n=1 Tax=Curvularia kusanoi TaxID=90978 RepID=A0A9P4T4Q0_CURKU|nr:DNA-binding transcription factor [Curvularia kusanoi]